MQSRTWALYLKRFAAALFVAYVLSVAFVYATSDSEYSRPWRDGLFGVLIFFVASVLMEIVNGLAGLLYLWFDKGRDFEELILSDLRLSRLPPPAEHQPRTMQYLAELASDHTALPQDRVNAAAFAASVATAGRNIGLFASMAWTEAADRAVLRYAKEAPRKRREEKAREDAPLFDDDD